MNYIRYEESRPEAMRRMLAASPVAYVPIGALEWHGEHGPLGLDGLKSRALCEAAAERTGGVVFPVVWWGAFDTVPFPFTLRYRKSDFRRLVRETLSQLGSWGFEAIVLLTGHYPPSLVRLLKKECRRFNRQGGALAFGSPEQVFTGELDYYGDHAGMWETSIMLALLPGLIDLSAMPAGLPTLDRLKKYGVMGQDPTTKASADKGRRAVECIAQGLAAAVERARKEKSDRAFEEVYRRYERSITVFPPRALHLAREALDVHSVGELIGYGLWTLKH